MLAGIVSHMYWANARVLDWLRQSRNSTEELLRLHSHILNAESVWIRRARQSGYDKDTFKVHGMESLRRLNEENNLEFNALLKLDLKQEVGYRLIEGTSAKSSLENMILHASTHGFHHRGQMASIASKAGRSFPNVSYIQFTRNRATLESLTFRETREKDIGQSFGIRASTRQNPVSSDQLAEWGFTPESVWEKYSKGEYCGWVCEDKGSLVGFCSGDITTGEVIVLAVLPQYEGLGIGKRLLSLLTQTLLGKGCGSLWLSASPDPEIRAHGFYRSNGWVPNGQSLENGDEILVYPLPG